MRGRAIARSPPAVPARRLRVEAGGDLVLEGLLALVLSEGLLALALL